MAKSRDRGKREVKKKKKAKTPKGAPAPFSGDAGFTPRREPGPPGSAGAPPA